MLKLTLYFNKATGERRPRHHPATVIWLAKRPFQQDQSSHKHALCYPNSPRVQLWIHRRRSSAQFGSIEKVQSQPRKSIESATGLTAWQRKRVQAPFSPSASIRTPSSMELNGNLPLRRKQMAVSRNQQKQATTRFSQCTHIWKPQRCFAKASHPQKANHKRHQVWVQPPCPSIQCLIDPGSCDGTYEYNGTKHNWKIWANNSKKQTYSQPELEMVLQHFCKQPSSKRASSGLLIRLLHLQTDQLGNCSREKISRSADSCNKKQLQISLPPRNTLLRNGPPNSNPTSRRQSRDHHPSTQFFGGATCPFEWGIMSELICDLANKLLKCEEWDPLPCTCWSKQISRHENT